MRPEKRDSTAIEPGLSALLALEKRTGQQLPLTIRRFVQQQQSEGVVEAAVRSTQRLLQDYQTTVGPLSPTIRLSKLAKLQSVELRGLGNIAATRVVGRGPSQRYHAAITMVGDSPTITIPPGSNRADARISVAHELGHLLIHSRGKQVDEITVKLGTSREEEALAEYMGRLLLMEKRLCHSDLSDDGMTRLCFDLSSAANVPLIVALARIGDPDQNLGVAGVIIWDLRRDRQPTIAERLRPYCRLCGAAFIPDRSHAREGSLTAIVASGESERIVVGTESVRIGRFVGEFRVEAYGWGSEERGTRKVLSIFCHPLE